MKKLKDHDTIRVFEGFAGYGGASFGLKRSGVNHQVIGYSEINKYASALFDANIKDANGKPLTNWGDIKQIDAGKLPDFDMFTGGFPCQPFSSAGMQRGVEDPYGRGTLLHEILRICEVKQPKYILLENVKGLTAKKFQGLFDLLKTWLRDHGYGELSYAVLNTKDYGIPQNRERLWMFAMKGGLPEGFSMVPPKPKKACPHLGAFLDKKPPEYLYLSDAQIAHLKEKHNIDSFVVEEPLCFDVYNKKIRRDAMSITITQPEHNSLRVIEVPKADGKEILRKMSVDEQFRLMGFKMGDKKRELDFAGQSYSQLSTRAGNGWDINVVGILLNHIFGQIL